MTWNEFLIATNELGFPLSDTQISQFHLYYDLLNEWNQKINLTALTSESDILEKHFYDSLLLAPFLKENHNLLDIGSGAGFPGIPIKIVFPQLEIVLLEPTGKRARFLELVIASLKLQKIQVINERAENYVKQKRETFFYVTARAVAPLAVLNELALPFIAIGGTFFPMKAKDTETEIAHSLSGIIRLGGKYKKINSFLLPSNEMRTIIEIEKEKPTPKKYPRQFGEIKNHPLIS
jgi:16S rRNA (guanine527-N7)-methyltransferase